MMLPTLQGECVDIPYVRNEVTSRDSRVRWVVETHVVEGLDLDRCGSPVVLVPPLGADLHPDNMYWTLYLKRGECGYDLGIVQGLGDPMLAEGEAYGLQNITTQHPAWLPNAEQRGNLIETRYAFDGVIYRAQRPRRY